MAIAFVGNLGTGLGTTDNVASLALTTTQNAPAGSLVVLLVAVDNIQSASGDATSPQVASVQNSGSANTWTRAKGWVVAPLGAQSGSDVEIWYSVLTNAIASGQTITATFTTASSADAQAMTAALFSLGVANTVAIEGTPAGLTNAGAAAGSLNVTTTNIQCLRVRAIGSESNSATALTPTSTWTIFAQAVSGAGTSTGEQGIRGEWLISTATGAASAPTGGAGAVDNASAYVAFREVFTNRTITQSARFDDGDTFNTAVLLAPGPQQDLVQTARRESTVTFGAPDPYTKLLLHCDGVDNTTTFIEETGLTVTPSGSAQIDTAESVFGGASGLVINGELQVPGANFALGTGDFVVEARVRSAGVASWQCVMSFRQGASVATPFLGFYVDVPIYHLSGTNVITGFSALTANTWYHYAVVRSSGVSRIFLNGVQTGPDYTDTNNFTAPTVLTIGAEAGAYSVQGWLDEVRVSIGTDRGWAGGFTPPASPHTIRLVATIDQPQSVAQTARFDDGDSFPQATLTPGAAPLTQTARYNDADNFPQATLSATVALTQAARFNDADNFPQATLSATVALTQTARFSDTPDTFGAAVVSRSTSQTARFDDPDSFPQATLTPGAAPLTQAARFNDPDSFGGHIVTQEGGPQFLAPDRFNDPDSFPQATLTYIDLTQALGQAARFDDPDTFFQGSIGAQIEAPPQRPGGSSNRARPQIVIIDPHERRRKIIEHDDRVVLSMVKAFLEDYPWAP